MLLKFRHSMSCFSHNLQERVFHPVSSVAMLSWYLAGVYVFVVMFATVQCEGKAYNDKSDMWALGCILYEMACLQKTFEGSNLPALVNKIMKVNSTSIP